MTQQIRGSQFVTTYGPGAILEGPDGPRLIPRPDIGLFGQNTSLDPDAFEISDQRMSEGLLRSARIFRLPSNAELNRPQNRYVYGTKPFPEWALCTEHWYLYRVSGRCPQCRQVGPSARRQAIRFIRACPAGHVDDVDWAYALHGASVCGHFDYYVWRGGGGALSQVEIECPRCSRRVNLGWAYGRDWPCGGRYPEKEPFGSAPSRPGCNESSRIIQRQASNLRIPELRTLFTIPPRYTRLHRLFELLPVRSALAALGGSVSSHGHLRAVLQNLVNSRLIVQATASEILNHPWPETQQAIHDVLSPVSMQYTDLLLEEFHALIDASVQGIPPLRGMAPASPVILEVIPGNVRTFPGHGGRSLRVVPVSRLRTVTVQTAYTRYVGTDPAHCRPVPVSFIDQSGQEWLPGAEHLGEGIFIMLDDNAGWHFPLTGNAHRWQSVFSEGHGYPVHLFRNPSREELSPIFVWWHTLSHLLLREIAIDSGYSSASVRERVYVEIEVSGSRGGVILYTTAPGADGTLGGLTGLVPRFERILNRALDQLKVCSNDPLCYETVFHQGSYNGAACYGCVLVSETSCEHRNMWLDRRTVLDNLP